MTSTVGLMMPPGGTAADRPCCDFCSGSAGRWIHDCGDVTMTASGPKGTAKGISLGAWVSCDRCLQFIQQGDADGLADYAARSGSGPAALIRMTSLSFRRSVFRRMYREVLPKLQPARPLTIEVAERWAEAARDYQPRDEASARRLAETLAP